MMDRMTSYLSQYLPSLPEIWSRPSIPDTWSRPTLPDNWPRYVGLVAGATVAATGAVVAWKCYQYRGVPPGPRGGIFGAVHLVKEDTFDYDLYDLSQKYGDVFSIRLGHNLLICLASHAAIKDAFVKQGDAFAYRGDDVNNISKYLQLKDDIFSTAYTKDGWNQKKSGILSCLRHAGFGQTKSTEERIINEFEKLMNFMEPLRSKQEPINLREILPKVTINIMFQILFSKEFSYRDPALEEKRKLVLDLMQAIVDANSDSLRLVPYYLAKIFCRKTIKSIQERCKGLRRSIRDEVEAHLSTYDADNPRDFVDYYMTKFGRENIPKLVDNIVMFIPDGCDSLAVVIEWVLLYVTYHQDVQTRVAKEILKETGGSRHVNWSDRAKFPFTEATIREVIRISTIFNITASHCVNEDTLFRGYRIPKGVDVYALMYAVHRDPNLYTDPSIFNPDRFLDEDGTLIKNDYWIPFGMGRRKCLGEQLVQIETFMIVANFIQRYSLKFPKGETVSLEPVLTSFFRKPKTFTVVLEERCLNQ